MKNCLTICGALVKRVILSHQPDGLMRNREEN
jgi:hypothetical protein